MTRLAVLSLFALVATGLAAPSAEQQTALNSVHVTSDRWNWEDCGIEYPIQVHSIDISPDPPVPGEDLTVTATATVNERIEDGAYADVVVKVGPIKLLQKEFDLCEEARNANASVSCPVEAGEYAIKETVKLPKEVPPAKFTVSVLGYTVDDDDMICLKLDIDFRKRRFLTGSF